MAKIKMAVWNMEWLNDLCKAGTPATLRPDGETPQHSGGTTVRSRLDDLSGMLGEIDPDVLVIVEGPDKEDELKVLFEEFNTGAWKVALQRTQYSYKDVNGTNRTYTSQQNVGIAVRTDRGHSLRKINTDTIAAFDEFVTDVDGDKVKESYRFARRPAYGEVTTADGKQFRVLGLHLKSKGIFSAVEWSQWWNQAEGNRRRIIAEANHLRSAFLEPYLQKAATKDIPLVVCGDINDGPGLDAAEKRLFGSGVERLMGDVWRPDVTLGNALFDTLTENHQKQRRFEKIFTSRYQDPIFNRVTHKVWIDHILYTRNKKGWIGEADVPKATSSGQAFFGRSGKYPDASDHYPVVATIDTSKL